MGFHDSMMSRYEQEDADSFEKDSTNAIRERISSGAKKSDRLAARAQAAYDEGRYDDAIELSRRGYIHELATAEYKIRQAFGR